MNNIGGVVSFCLFLIAHGKPAAMADKAALTRAVSEALGGRDTLTRIVMHTPISLDARDPYLEIERPPVCVLQFYAGNISAIETLLHRGGPIDAMFNEMDQLTSGALSWSHQAMATRKFTLFGDLPTTQPREQFSYLVEYNGSTLDDEAWLSQYVEQHPPLMLALPEAKGGEVCSRLDYCSGVAAPRAYSLQRNKVYFDSKEALGYSLNSEERHALRRDYETFPPFSGCEPHFAMRSELLWGG